MNTKQYHAEYIRRQAENLKRDDGRKAHSLHLLKKMYPLPIYTIANGFRYDISDTPLYQDLFGQGWDKFYSK